MPLWSGCSAADWALRTPPRANRTQVPERLRTLTDVHKPVGGDSTPKPHRAYRSKRRCRANRTGTAPWPDPPSVRSDDPGATYLPAICDRQSRGTGTRQNRGWPCRRPWHQRGASSVRCRRSVRFVDRADHRSIPTRLLPSWCRAEILVPPNRASPRGRRRDRPDRPGRDCSCCPPPPLRIQTPGRARRRQWPRRRRSGSKRRPGALRRALPGRCISCTPCPRSGRRTRWSRSS
mmetsp:Transcript_7566/g.16562  ORF Transcript_7566/g.16562 Transcript_7566/m.16562 type:complete len:234 (-) Transcript_7566:173-874(-)